MKEASGEFSMTLIVIVGAIAIVTLLTTVVIPLAQDFIQEEWQGIRDDVNNGGTGVTPINP